MCFARGWKRASPGVTGRHRETTLKKCPEFFFAWTRKVLTSLDQRNLVCLNRINDNWSTAFPIPPKTAKNCKNGPNVHFRQKWIDCRSVIVYPIWANLVALIQGRKYLSGPPKKMLEIFLTWSPGDACFRPRAKHVFGHSASKFYPILSRTNFIRTIMEFRFF